MKIRTKLAVCSALIVAAAAIICCLVVVGFAKQNVMNAVSSTCFTTYEKFYTNFKRLTAETEELSGSAMRSQIQYQMKQTEGYNDFVLQQNNDVIINNTGIDPETALSDKSTKVYQPTDIVRALKYTTLTCDGASYFIVGSEIAINQTGYALSLVYDTTEQMNDVAVLAWKCICAGSIVAAIAALFILAVVIRSFRPIKKLQAGASDLAHGRYENRINIEGKNELSELAADFNKMADAIAEHIEALKETTQRQQETAERQQAFINGLSHELKTPITSIMISSQTLYTVQVSEEHRNRSLKRIYDGCGWLERLSGKLMTLVMLQGKIDLKKEDVSALLAAVAETVSEMLKEKNISLLTSCKTEMLEMDFDLMQSALVNIVDNARKASPPNSHIELNAYDNIIEVNDHGCGMPQDEISRITEPFYMVDRSRSKKNGGSGLGLALVKRIAEAHNAELSIESDISRGTIVRIVFSENAMHTK